MSHIFDNIALHLFPALKQAIQPAHRDDFCVSYFNLRAWKELDPLFEPWIGGEGNCVRLLVGIQSLPEDELRSRVAHALWEADVEIK